MLRQNHAKNSAQNLQRMPEASKLRAQAGSFFPKSKGKDVLHFGCGVN
jgi:hypothetical protein